MLFSMQPIPQPILLMEQIRHPPVLNIPLFTGIPKRPNGGKRRISEPSTVSHPIHPPNLDASKFWEVFQVELKTGSFNVFRILAAVDVLVPQRWIHVVRPRVFLGFWYEKKWDNIPQRYGMHLVEDFFYLFVNSKYIQVVRKYSLTLTIQLLPEVGLWWISISHHISNLKSTPKNGPASSVRALSQQISTVWGPCWPTQCMPGSARVGPWGCQLCSLDLEVVGNPLTHMVQPQFSSHIHSHAATILGGYPRNRKWLRTMIRKSLK